MRLLTLLLALVASCTVTPAFAAPVYGVNLASGGFGDNPSSRPYGWDYVYPTNSDIDLVKAMGGKFVRLVVLPERIQPARMGPLHAEVPRYIYPLIAYARSKGVAVIIDLHSWGRFLNWTREERRNLVLQLMKPYANLPAAVMIELDNEPVATPDAMKEALDTRDDMRKDRLRNRVLIPTPGWSPTYAFMTNGAVEVARARPDANTLYVGHVYFDVDSSGTHDECVAGAADRVDPVIASGLPTAITEIGIANTPTCLAEWRRFKAKVAIASNVKMVALWELAWWAGDYRYALGKDGKATPLWRALVGR